MPDFDNWANTEENSSGRLLFQEPAIINVTYFDVEPPVDPNEPYSLGYLCGGVVSVFSDGTIATIDDEGENTEKLKISDLIWQKTNINNNDPAHSLEISFVTDSKEIGVEFRSPKAKARCKEVLLSLLETLENK